MTATVPSPVTDSRLAWTAAAPGPTSGLPLMLPVESHCVVVAPGVPISKLKRPLEASGMNNVCCSLVGCVCRVEAIGATDIGVSWTSPWKVISK